MQTATIQTVKEIKGINFHPSESAAAKAPFYKQLNGLRFIFIFMVLLQHWGPHQAFEHFHLAWLGVNLFFVLSGFLIGEILLLEKQRTTNIGASIKNFIIRRALRIFPLYYLTIIIYGILFSTGGMLIWNLTYTNNILSAIDINRVPKEFWHIWSLCVEEQFYLFFPLLLSFVPRRYFLYCLIGGISLSVIGRFLICFFKVGDYHHITYSLMPFSLDCLFMGVLLAYLKVYHSQKAKQFFAKKLMIYASLIIAAIFTFAVCTGRETTVDNTLFRFGGAVLGFLLIGFAAVKEFSGIGKWFLENKVIAYLGKISYGIYLLHPFVEKLYYQYFDNNKLKATLVNFHLPLLSNRYIIDFFILFTLTILIATLSFQLIEKRFLKLKLLFN